VQVLVPVQVLVLVQVQVLLLLPRPVQVLVQVLVLVQVQVLLLLLLLVQVLLVQVQVQVLVVHARNIQVAQGRPRRCDCGSTWRDRQASKDAGTQGWCRDGAGMVQGWCRDGAAAVNVSAPRLGKKKHTPPAWQSRPARAHGHTGVCFAGRARCRHAGYTARGDSEWRR